MTFPTARIAYRTFEFGTCDIHVRTLRDNQQFEDPEGAAADLGIYSATWPLFGVVWDSSQVLARLMLDYDIEGKRVLEIGCGIGLATLVLNHRGADITATDHHPEAGKFLKANTQLNDGPDVPFVRTGWEDPPHDGLSGFGLVIGSDLLYESNHSDLLSAFIDQHAEPRCEVVMVDPGRGNHAQFSKKMVKLGFSHSQSKLATSDYLTQPFRGRILRYQR